MRTGGFVAACAMTVAGFLAVAMVTRAEEPKKPAEKPKLVKAGTVQIQEYEAGIGVADVVWGHGEVQALGQKKRFRLNGMGAGGGGGAKISAEGTVYNMKDIGLFAGVYNEEDIGVVGGKAGKITPIWLRNTNGVILELRGKQTGLAVTGGSNGVLIQFEE
jgi:hypothetical protein